MALKLLYSLNYLRFLQIKYILLYQVMDYILMEITYLAMSSKLQ